MHWMAACTNIQQGVQAAFLVDKQKKRRNLSSLHCIDSLMGMQLLLRNIHMNKLPAIQHMQANKDT